MRFFPSNLDTEKSAYLSLSVTEAHDVIERITYGKKCY